MKLDYKKTIFVGMAFFLICTFWQAYDTIIPKILTDKFGTQGQNGEIVESEAVYEEAAYEEPASEEPAAEPEFEEAEVTVTVEETPAPENVEE